MTSELPAGTVTFLFTDIEGSTPLWEREPERMRPALAHHHAILRQAVAAHNGQVFKVIGDAIQAAFALPGEALNAALAAQRELEAADWPTSAPLRVRMGLHTGPAELAGADYATTHTLNRVARIMAAGHGGQILLSVAVADLVRDSLRDQAVLRDLGQHRLKGLTQPEHLYQVVTPDLPAEFPALKWLDAVPNNLPASLMSILGRERETAALHQILVRPEVHLVTITGPGGVGKTSLSLHIAQDLRDAFADGVFFIPLAPINDPTLVLPTVARTLGLAESPNRLILDSLKEFLRDKQVLLVFDNFEQITSAAPLLSELLSACAELRMLVTSREALQLRGEHEFPLSPLELASPASVPDRPSVEKLLQYPSIALFVQCAQAHQPDFNLRADNAEAVVEICARLDGLPLALELAAARIKLLPPQAMLTRLQQSSLGLLTSGARDLPARQQTLRGAVQWSYDLLSAAEQRTFRWLSSFVNGATLEAAAHMTGGPSSAMVLDLVDLLIRKSLIRQIETDGEPRLNMLETIREFGLECLAQAQELAAARRVHAAYCLSLAEEAERHLSSADQKAWLQRLDREQDNLRAALRWGFEQPEAGWVLRLAGALWQFWFLRGQWSEGRRWLEEALSMNGRGTSDPAFQAKALYGASVLARFQGDFARAQSLGARSITLYRALGDREGLLGGLLQLGRTFDLQGDESAISKLTAEIQALARELPDSAVKGRAYAELPVLGRRLVGVEATRSLAESERINRALNNPSGLAYTLVWQGAAAILGGDYARASACYDEAERLAGEADDQRIGLRVAQNRALLAWRQGDYDSAFRNWMEYIRRGRMLGEGLLPAGLEILAAALQRRGLSPWAARVHGMVDAWQGKSQQANTVLTASADAHSSLAHFSLAGLLRPADLRAEVRAQLGEERYVQEWTKGRRMTLDDLLSIPQPQGPSPAAAGLPSTTPISPAPEPLTAREMDVIHLLAQDLGNTQIAERLVVSRRTVDAHLRSIYEKLGVKSRDAAVRVARERRLISAAK